LQHVVRKAATDSEAFAPTGCDLETSRKAQKIAHQHQGVYFTAGVHPHNAKECGAATLDGLRELARDSLCVAVGECGLDFNRNFSPADVQEEWFDKQVRPGKTPSCFRYFCQSSANRYEGWVRSFLEDVLGVGFRQTWDLQF